MAEDIGHGSALGSEHQDAPPSVASVPRWDPPTPDDVKCRMEDLASTLHILNGMSRCGGALSEDYRAHEVPAIRRFANRIFDALERGEAARQPWDHANAK